MTRWSSRGPSWANVGNTPFRYFKSWSYEGGINTPCIAFWPGKIQASSFTGFHGHFIDFMTTFVDITGAKYPEEFNNQKIVPMQGISLLPVFKGEKAEREKPIFWEWNRGQAVYSNGFKIVKQGTDRPWDLYDIKNDPTEINNLAKEKPEKVKELDLMFKEWKSSMPDNSK
jgi:arylsulfatase